MSARHKEPKRKMFGASGETWVSWRRRRFASTEPKSRGMALALPKRKQSAETYLVPVTPSPSELTLWHITLLNDPELNQRRESWTTKHILASPILSPLGEADLLPLYP